MECSPEGKLGEQSTVSCQRKPSPPPSHPAGARSCRENGMTLPGHLAGGGAERGDRGAACVAFVI